MTRELDRDKQTVLSNVAPMARDADEDNDRSPNARAVSNAYMKKQGATSTAQTAASKPVTAHRDADAASFATATDGLNTLARKFYEWGESLGKDRPTTEAGQVTTETALDDIRAIFALAERQTHAVEQLKAKADPTDKVLLGPAALNCRASFKGFAQQADAAAKWASKFAGAPKSPVEDLEKIVDRFTENTNADGAEIVGHKAPGDAHAMNDNLIEDLVRSISADVSSAELGNAADASRIIVHTRSLLSFAKPKDPVLVKHVAELKKLAKRIETVRDNTKNSDLNEAVLGIGTLAP